MSSDLLLGIDVGTSGCKVAVVGDDGVELATGRRPLRWREVDGGAELDASSLLGVVDETIAAALADAPNGRVLAVGVASMAEAGFPLDGRGEPMAPAMAWHDERAAGELDALVRDLEAFVETTGLRVTARPPAVRLRWLLGSRRLSRPPARWLNIAEYVVHALGGDQVAEPSLASRTGWLDVAGGGWWAPSLAWTGVDRALLPELREAGVPAGRATDRMGALAGATLTVAGHDHLVAAVGAGVLRSGSVVNSCGTAEVLLRTVDRAPAPALRRRAARLGFTTGRHVVAPAYAVIGGFPSGTLLSRAARALGFDDPQHADAAARRETSAAPASLSTELDGVGGLLERVRRLERSGPPAVDVGAGEWRALVDAVASHGAGVLEQLQQLTGPSDRVVTVGGSAQGSLVAEARHRYLGAIERPAVREAAARGAALLAGVAAGIYADVTAVPTPAPTPSPVLAPMPSPAPIQELR